MEAIPIKVSAGRMIKKVPNNMYLSGVDAGVCDCAVQTTKETLEEAIVFARNLPGLEQLHLFKKSWNIIKDIKPDIDVHNQEKWSEFCDYLLIFYCCRFIIFGTPMPIFSSEDQQKMLETAIHG
jgi:hypothetical protein